jgi:hypothetical protein
MLDAARTRRADRLLDGLLGGLPTVELGAITRDVEKLDQTEPVAGGEIALGGEISTLYIAVLLRRRGFVRCGDNGKSGLHREPVYSLGHHPPD